MLKLWPDEIRNSIQIRAEFCYVLLVYTNRVVSGCHVKCEVWAAMPHKIGFTVVYASGECYVTQIQHAVSCTSTNTVTLPSFLSTDKVWDSFTFTNQQFISNNRHQFSSYRTGNQESALDFREGSYLRFRKCGHLYVPSHWFQHKVQWCGPWRGLYWFLGAFAKLRRRLLNFVMYERPSVRPHGTTRFQPEDFP